MSGFSRAFEIARAHVNAGRLPTAVLGVATAEGVVALDAFGATNGRPARTDDAHFLFSITKPLVGLTAARAVERGILSPLTSLGEAVPEFADRPVQLRHLVSHTAGITEPPLDTRRGLRPELRTAGSDFAPGTASRYSSIAFDGIAALLEAADGRPWDAQLAEWADAVGAAGLTLDPACDPHHPVDATEAGMDMGALVRLRHPGAGLMGRAEDLLAIGAALLRDDGAIVRPRTLAMMRRPLTGDIPRLEPFPAERGQDWGFTWNLRTRAPGLIDRDVYGHSGWAGTEFWVHPSAGVAWVLLTNQALRPGVDPDLLDNAIVSAA
jgi:CubicO group peptidase (beta-lactamase class C family)